MSKIFELFGYPLDRWNAAAEKNLSKAHCPFMNAPCDGGGNRYLSAVRLSDKPQLKARFGREVGDVVQCGICSLQLQDGRPWIVCPRRLLSLRGAPSSLQKHVMDRLLDASELRTEKICKAWSEVKIKISRANAGREAKIFDYAFDYVITGVKPTPMKDAAAIAGMSELQAHTAAINGGYTVALRRGEQWVEDFPSDPVVIVEIMTSSTSGGNKNRRTQMPMAFEDAVLHGPAHAAPGINYRQVWARMVSQLIVKSQIGNAWGGKTFWLLQDVLADYISDSTALDLRNYIARHASEVNMLAFGYGDFNRPGEMIPLSKSVFYAGKIDNAPRRTSHGGFVDIVKLGTPPPKDMLWRALFKKSPCGVIRP